MELIIKVAASLILMFGIFWTLLPWGFGVHNYGKSHGKTLAFTARVCWSALLIAHPVLIYFIWFQSLAVLYSLISIILAHIGFFVLFGRNLGGT
jgi:hypothetical protein